MYTSVTIIAYVLCSIVFTYSDVSLFQDMLKTRAALPIAHLKGDILKLLKENNVLVVCGETGSGKTTQVNVRSQMIWFRVQTINMTSP